MPGDVCFERGEERAANSDKTCRVRIVFYALRIIEDQHRGILFQDADERRGLVVGRHLTEALKGQIVSPDRFFLELNFYGIALRIWILYEVEDAASYVREAECATRMIDELERREEVDALAISPVTKVPFMNEHRTDHPSSFCGCDRAITKPKNRPIVKPLILHTIVDTIRAQRKKRKVIGL